MSLQSEARKKTYSPPKLNKPPEQAQLILTGHSTCGGQGATNLLGVLYPSPEPERNHNVCANFEDEQPAQVEPETSRLMRRALTVLQSSREDFHWFARG